MIFVAIGMVAFACFCWLLCIGASLVGDTRFVERDNQHYRKDK